MVLTRCFKNSVQLAYILIKRMKVGIWGVETKIVRPIDTYPKQNKASRRQGDFPWIFSLLKRAGLNRYEFEKTMTMSFGYISDQFLLINCYMSTASTALTRLSSTNPSSLPQTPLLDVWPCRLLHVGSPFSMGYFYSISPSWHDKEGAG
jgi:hypothetical protein